MDKIFFITATGTDIGKTFILEKIARNLREEGYKVKAIKPLISGFREHDKKSDTVRILKALGRKVTDKNVDAISPWRLYHGLSPNVAAHLEGKEVEFSEVLKFCRHHVKLALKHDYYLFIEGAGGVATPINDDKTFLDLMAKLKVPAILVSGNYLGTISHSLTAVMALQRRKISIDRIILNCKKTDVIDEKDTMRNLHNFTGLKVITNYELT